MLKDKPVFVFGVAVGIFLLYGITRDLVESAHLHFNYTNSVPVGLYQETREQANSYAGFCLPESVLHTLSKQDIRTVRGTCPGGFAPILKPLIQATPKHPVALSMLGFSVDGKIVPNTAPRSDTHSGAMLAHYPFGRYTEGLWAISSFNANSYDSRYFGPVSPSAIQFYAKPLLTPWRRN